MSLQKPRPAGARRARKSSLTDRLAEAIRNGAYRPGEWLRQIDIEAQFDATRFDVRTALNVLSTQKTIEHVPNRGYRVAVVDDETYSHIRETRIILETATAAAVVARAGPEALSRLKEKAAAFGEAIRSGTREDQSRANAEFHRLLYSLCGNPILEETIQILRDRPMGPHVTVWRSHEALLRSESEHYAMIEALEIGDAARLADLIRQHIRRAQS
jgi:DNA-binding GntR family transcriptional regulator